MPNHKPSKSAKSHSVSSDSLSAHATPGWKWKVLGFICFLILLTGVWSSGIVQDMLAGPKIPLPRQAADLSLGMPLQDVLQKYPVPKSKIRPFNNDPEFSIIDLDDKKALGENVSGLELLFYKDQLYFVSTMWDSDKAAKIPLQEWVKQFRRWGHSANSNPESLGDKVLLKEWHFADKQTEMTLRDLNYPDHMQRWQDLRDASNQPAQAAFAKYRLDSAS